MKNGENTSFRTWAQVSKTALTSNFHTIRSGLPPNVKIMAVVKADGYGHGAVTVANALEGQADWLGVASLEEALILREAGLSTPILVLGYTPVEQTKALAEHHITQTVYDTEYAAAISAEAQSCHCVVDCHIKVDTGMNRLGFPAWGNREQDCAREILQVCALQGLSFQGIFTHFAKADERTPDGIAFTTAQYHCFTTVLELLSQEGKPFSLRHCCNSAGTLCYPHMALDMVRVGIALYGVAPSPHCTAFMKGFSPVMSLHTKVAMVKQVPPGGCVSYGGMFVTPKEGAVLATVGMGYADGLRRSAGNGRGVVLIHGQKAPIVGRVCMDQCIVDVSRIPHVCQGDEVTLVGTQGKDTLTFDHWAALDGTIPYEEMCLIGKRVPRIVDFI